MLLLNAIIFWIHLLAATLFIGGSFFMWLVAVPAARLIAEGEAERTLIIGKIAKKFGRLSWLLLVTLITTGLYNLAWYAPSLEGLLYTLRGSLLLLKMIMVVFLVTLIYVNNVHLGRRMTRFAREGELEALRALRRKSRLLSSTNLAIMLAILAIVTALRFTP